MYFISKIAWSLHSRYILRTTSTFIKYENINKFGSLFVKCPSVIAHISSIDPLDCPNGDQACISVSDVSVWDSMAVEFNRQSNQLKIEENSHLKETAVLTIKIPHSYDIHAEAKFISVNNSENKTINLFSAQDCMLGKIKSFSTNIVCQGNLVCKSLLSNANLQSKGDVKIGKIQSQEICISASNDIQVDSIYCGSANMKSIVGSIFIKNVHGILDSSTTSGSLVIGSLDGNLNATTTSGNIRVLIERCNEKVYLATHSGNIEINLSDKISASIEAEGALVDVQEEVLFDGMKQHISNEIEKFEGKVGDGKSEIIVFSKTGFISFLKGSWFSSLNIN